MPGMMDANAKYVVVGRSGFASISATTFNNALEAIEHFARIYKRDMLGDTPECRTDSEDQAEKQIILDDLVAKIRTQIFSE